MEVKATVICENYVMSNLGAVAEHGWALHIKTNHGNFLFDTGQGKGLLNNARVFRIDLSGVQGIVISHHHVDHTGGLLDAVSSAGSVPVYAHPDLFKRQGYVTRNGKRMQIGLPFVRELLESRGAEFRLNKEWTEIAPQIFLTGEIPRKTPYEVVEPALQTQDETGEFVPDPIMDDQALVIDTKKGLLIVLGCAHAGIVNTINHAMEKTGKTHIHAVIGGTHLWPVSEDQREKTIEALQTFDMDYIGVSHCTGLLPAMRLARTFGQRFLFCNVGSVFEM